MFFVHELPLIYAISEEMFSHSGIRNCPVLIRYTLILSLPQNMIMQQEDMTRNTEFLLVSSVSVREKSVITGTRHQSCPFGVS